MTPFDSDNDIDRLLHLAAARWRSGQPPPPDPSIFAPSDTNRADVPRFALSAAVIIAVLAIASTLIYVGTRGLGSAAPTPVATAAVAASTSKPTATPQVTAPSGPSAPVATPSPRPTADLSGLVVTDGAFVSATGRVRESGGNHFVICGPAASLQGLDPAACWGVPITGVDGSALPGWSGQQQSSSPVTVFGTWSGGTIKVSRFTPPVVQSPTPPAVPCQPPDGGWPDNSGDEQSGRLLAAEVLGHPELYSGVWTLNTAEPGHPLSLVTTVGTVGELDSVRGKLARIFPQNLCVVSVEFSRTQLKQLETRLADQSERQNWFPSADTVMDRVTLGLLFVDADVASILAGDAEMLNVQPFVRPSVP